MKPHQQSEHQVGYRAPRATEVSSRLAWGSLALVIALVFLLNMFPDPAPTSCAAPAQVASQK
ncbi:hypothetical protein SAMN06295970_11768 [Noviherbaspirillum suwonense]|uniref:Uncharacterized protein n=1 Tax=Noviherbaspirillum suwonense TaxID=1224511 RepID=A0ABY1QIF3_9BURK|nr:hypothetical protein SAMN06295970_11768 [Noviherbaspirillum suwonense]